MFVRFAVGNFRSFRDKVSFSLEKHGQGRELPENCFGSPALPSRMSLLKSAVIYGANASGKSNLVQALTVMQSIVLRSGVGDRDVAQMLEPFALSEKTQEEPVFFELEMVADGRRYRYGFECTRDEIVSEWLYAQKRRMTLMFAREDNQFVEASPDFAEKKAWSKVLKDTRLNLPRNALFLSTAARMFAGGACEAVLNWFERTLLIVSAHTYQQYLGTTFAAMKNSELAGRISQLISRADLGIQKVEASDAEAQGKTSGLSRIGTTHLVGGRTYHFDMFHHESSGTQKIFALSAPLLDVLKNGKVLFMDELDASLHPLLVSQLIEMFHGGNSANAQLVATTHSPSILTETTLRHDQVWFVGKDDNGSSNLASLADFTGIRGNFTRITKDYLHGCFGGIPYIKSLKVEG
ncbi:MAG: ATP-binding protein [Victivallales bacterium]|nr:ATP-binding protein [Victivallales bacterium]